MGDVLALSRSYEPVGNIRWQRAITLLYDKKVEVVASYDDWTVKSVSIEIPVPSVVRHLTGVAVRKRHIKFSRAHIYARDKGKCQYCGGKVAMDEFTYDHVIPRIQGGRTNWDNVVVSCVKCNQRKGGRTPSQAGMNLLSTPVKPKSMPGGISISLTYKTGMPEVWKNYLRSTAYWGEELIQD